VIRVSIGVDSTEHEVDGFCVALRETVERLRSGALV
jgi:cysteine sulfinate desulfinase/cysteine desulfurase-like protein